jgi:hypothetical protein
VWQMELEDGLIEESIQRYIAGAFAQCKFIKFLDKFLTLNFFLSRIKDKFTNAYELLEDYKYIKSPTTLLVDSVNANDH